MAITGRFQADFASFLDAIRKSEVALVDMGKGASGVESRLNKMTDSFSGRRIIQEATLMATAIEAAGGTSRLTGAELERVGAKAAEAADKLKRLGYEVPPGIQKLADEVKHAGVESETSAVSFGKLVSSYLTAQAIIAGVKTAFNLVTGEISRSITAAADAEKAHTQLVSALHAQGTAVPSVVQAYGEYATALQRTTIFQDDAIEATEKTLVLVGNVMPRDMEKALKATTDLASGLGIDLTTATLQVAKAAEGNVTALKKAGITLDETKAKEQGFGYVLDEIEKKFAGQAETLAGTYQGRLIQLGNTWNNVEESIGRVITQNATVLKAFDLINQAIDSQTGELKDNAAATNLVSDAVLIAVRGFGTLANAFDVAQTYGTAFMISVRNIGAGLVYVGIVALEAAKGLAFTTANFSGARVAQAAIESLRDVVKEFGDRNVAATERSVAFGNKLQEIAAKANQLGVELAKTRGQTIKLAEGTDTAKNAWDRNTQAMVKEEGEAMKVTSTFGLLDGAIGHVADGITIAGDHIHTVVPYFGELARGLEGVGDKMQPLEAQVMEFSIGALPYMASSLQKSTTQLDAWFGTLQDGLGALPGLLQKGLTGGGGFAGAFKALSANIGGGLFAAGGPLNSIGNSLTKSAFGISETFGNALGAALPAIGSLIGPAIQGIASLFGKIFGNPEKQINPIREAFVQAAGGLDALNQHAAAAGVTLNAMLDAKNPEQYKKAIDDLNAAFALSDKATKAADDTVTKFGLTISELGPKFKQQKLDEQAAGLINDYGLLDAVAKDHSITLEKLAPSVNAYVQSILAAGGTVPEQLRDPIKQMRELGLLTDESGTKFTDAQLDGITFATTLDAKFTTLIGGIQKLVDLLVQKLGPAIDSLPTEHTVHIGYSVDAPPDLGGDYGAGPIRAAGGYSGRVTQPTLFLAGEAGPEDVNIGQAGEGAGASKGLLNEIRGLRQDMQSLPRMFRDAVLTAT